MSKKDGTVKRKFSFELPKLVGLLLTTRAIVGLMTCTENRIEQILQRPLENRSLLTTHNSQERASAAVSPNRPPTPPRLRLCPARFQALAPNIRGAVWQGRRGQAPTKLSSRRQVARKERWCRRGAGRSQDEQSHTYRCRGERVSKAADEAHNQEPGLLRGPAC